MMVVVFLLLLLYQQTWASNSCPCNGIEVQMSDQEHCFEIHQNSGSSWSSADQTCASIGGFMAHVTDADLFKTLSTYIDQNYNLPVMTGATVANAELDLVALMCPGNTFYALLNSTIVSEYFNGTPSDSTRCAFITNDNTYKMHYMACDTSSNVLCDRPMSTENYCNIKMNCTETTTSILTTLASTTSGSSKSLITTVPTTTSHTTTTSATNSTLTTTKSGTSSVTQSSTRVSTGSTATLTSTTSTTSTVSTSTTGNTSQDCGKGYTRIFGWCVPWWCWLIFGLLLLLLFLCCFGWLCHFCCTSCLCCHAQPEQVPEKIPEGIALDAICQTDANAIESRQVVYVPVPKTPPPQRRIEPVVVERQATPPLRPASPQIIHHHHHEAPREPVAAPPPPMVYDIKHTENNYTYNNYIIPPIIQQPQIVPSMYYPPERAEIPMYSAPQSYTPPPLPLYEEDFAHVAPPPAITQDVVEPMILHDPETIVTLPPREEKPEMPKPEMPRLKHNRPPVSSPVKIVPVEKRIDMPEPRTFPAPPPAPYVKPQAPQEPEERPFPRPPPIEKRDQPIRKNTPLGVARQPERLREPPQRRDEVATPPMDRLPTRLPFEVPSPEPEKPAKKKRPKSPPVEIFEPPAAPAESRPKRNRRLSPKVEPSPSPPSSEPSQRSNNNASPFARFREPGASPEPSSSGRNSAIDPSMREARGRLGGVRRGGPEGWKPWSKSSEPFSGHPGYLNAD